MTTMRESQVRDRARGMSGGGINSVHLGPWEPAGDAG